MPHPASPPTRAITTTADTALAVVASSQFGAFTRAQAYQAGLSRGQVMDRIASGLWVLIHPKVMIAATTPRSPATRAVAGLLYAGDRAWFSHATAARLRGIDPQLVDPRIWITVPVDVMRTKQTGLQITRSRRITNFTSVAHGFPTMTDARTIVDLARVADGAALQRILYDVVSREVVTIEDVLAAAEDFGGRVGIAVLREVTTEFSLEHESALELDADTAFRRAGIFLEPQLEVGRAAPDRAARLRRPGRQDWHRDRRREVPLDAVGAPLRPPAGPGSTPARLADRTVHHRGRPTDAGLDGPACPRPAGPRHRAAVAGVVSPPSPGHQVTPEPRPSTRREDRRAERPRSAPCRGLHDDLHNGRA